MTPSNEVAYPVHQMGRSPPGGIKCNGMVMSLFGFSVNHEIRLAFLEVCSLKSSIRCSSHSGFAAKLFLIQEPSLQKYISIVKHATEHIPAIMAQPLMTLKIYL